MNKTIFFRHQVGCWIFYRKLLNFMPFCGKYMLRLKPINKTTKEAYNG